MVASSTEATKKKATTTSKTGVKSTKTTATSATKKPKTATVQETSKAAVETSVVNKKSPAAASALSTSKKGAIGVVAATRPAVSTVKAEMATPPKYPVSALPDQETIDKMIAEAAYYLAEQRNFAPGFDEQDWATAREQVMAQLQAAQK